MEERTKNPPIDEVRVGPLRVAVWENVNSKGEVYYTLQPERIYEGNNGELCTANTFTLSQSKALWGMLQLAGHNAQKLKNRRENEAKVQAA